MRGERRRIRYETRQHGVVLARPLARALVVAATGLALVLYGAGDRLPVSVAGAVLAALAALLALRAVLAWDRTKVVVTDDELYVVHGLIRRRRAVVELAPGAALEVEQSLAGRMLGYGTVVAGELEIPHVPHPGRLRGLAA